jgi:hypothetical protein
VVPSKPGGKGRDSYREPFQWRQDSQGEFVLKDPFNDLPGQEGRTVTISMWEDESGKVNASSYVYMPGPFRPANSSESSAGRAVSFCL